MKTPLAWLNLVHNKLRTTVAVAGVSFAVVLIFMQLGFLGSLRTSAAVIYNALDFDLCIRSRDYLHLSDPRDFPRQRLQQAAAVPGVMQTSPFYITVTRWRIPETAPRNAGETRGILAMGIRRGDAVFRVPEIQENASGLLANPELFLVDRKTRPDYGPIDGNRFGAEDVRAGMQTELGGRTVRVAGLYTLGAGFAADGSVLLNAEGFQRATGMDVNDRANLGLIRLRPGMTPEDAETVRHQLRSMLPDDVDVLTREEVIQAEIRRWVDDTSYGTIFKLGVAVAMVVGIAIVYQVLSADVTALLSEYATLKAVGYRNRTLAGFVLQEALVLSLVGFAPGAVVSWALYHVTAAAANVPIQMTLATLLTVLLLSLAMCLASGLGALRKLFGADPAELF